jgi:hypothetical protein
MRILAASSSTHQRPVLPTHACMHGKHIRQAFCICFSSTYTLTPACTYDTCSNNNTAGKPQSATNKHYWRYQQRLPAAYAPAVFPDTLVAISAEVTIIDYYFCQTCVDHGRKGRRSNTQTGVFKNKKPRLLGGGITCLSIAFQTLLGTGLGGRAMYNSWTFKLRFTSKT